MHVRRAEGKLIQTARKNGDLVKVNQEEGLPTVGGPNKGKDVKILRVLNGEEPVVHTENLGGRLWKRQWFKWARISFIKKLILFYSAQLVKKLS